MSQHTLPSSSDSSQQLCSTRRRLLTAGGVLAVGSLAGCVSRAASMTTNTDASPAGMFGGIRDDRLIPVTPGETIRYAPTVRVEEQLLSGDVTLEAWMTTTHIAPAQDYNTVRSNKRRSTFAVDSGDLDDDDVDGNTDPLEVRAAALDLERQLLAQTTAVLALSRQSARTGRNPQTGREIQGYLDEMSATIDEIQATLAHCSDAVCETVLHNADHRKRLLSTARSYYEGDQQWAAAEEAVADIHQLVEGDIERLEAALREQVPAGAHAPSIARLQTLTGATDDEIHGLYAYLDGEPILSERCVITLPDARAPQGGPSIESLITPRHVIEFITGRADADGELYSWGRDRYELAASDDDDGDDTAADACSEHTGTLSSDEQLYCWGGPLSATGISGPLNTYGSLDVLTSDAGVAVITVVNDPPRAGDERSTIGVTSAGEPTDVETLDDWGRERGPASSTSTVVCQVLVQPSGCPCPFPALLHVQRNTNNDQYLYSCGWVIDESCLYENSITALTMHRGRGGGAGKVVVTDLPLPSSGALREADIRRVLPDDVSPIGAQMFSGPLADAVDLGVIPDAELARAVMQAVSSDGEVYCSCYPFDGQCLHLVADGSTSNTVTFKAGSELSKSVN